MYTNEREIEILITKCPSEVTEYNLEISTDNFIEVHNYS